MAKAGNPSWGKGKSGNPNGRPKGYADFANRCRDWADKYGIKYLMKLAESSDLRIRMDSTRYLIDRGYGKPKEHLEHSGGLENSYTWAKQAIDNPELADDISKLMGKIAK